MIQMSLNQTHTLSSMASKNFNTLQIVTIFFVVFLPIAYSLNYPAVFNFGDSNSDTGGLTAGLGFRLPQPYGDLYFNDSSSSAGRFSDGRLIVDFLSTYGSLE